MSTTDPTTPRATPSPAVRVAERRAETGPVRERVRVDGKFFRAGDRRFYIRGVTYGPFAVREDTGALPSKEQIARDFDRIRELGANVVRVYHAPGRWFYDLAAAHGLRVFVDIPWPTHGCFLDSPAVMATARAAVRAAVQEGHSHPAVLAYSVANEIPSDVVRWSGALAVAEFLDELIGVAKAMDPECLCTFASFPPTEFLRPQLPDFACYNVFLHERAAFERYLEHLQTQADARPLVIGELGIDSRREGEGRQEEILSWQVEAAFQGGVAGLVVFSYTDDWCRGGRRITDWTFGLTTRAREPKRAWWAVREKFREVPFRPLPRYPRVSVVVACYNGERTLRTCLDSLTRLTYPDYEVILVDDGSTDATPEVARGFPRVLYIRQANHGLSVARNTGIAASTGEVVAFTDADCRADEDWLHHAVNRLLRTGFAAVGGHNLLPPEDSQVAAAVMVSPGGPTHVMLTDTEAEHIPGCNMVFHRWALEQLDGFDPVFRKAGDDVDVCWRLQQLGHRIGFAPESFVWHYRRSSVGAYLKQQYGYGEAEALLARKHPERFGVLGGGIWRGRIYSPSRPGAHLAGPVIYHGRFGSALFQRLYAPAPAPLVSVLTSFEFLALFTLPLLVLSVAFPGLLPLGLASLGLALAFCGLAAGQAELAPGQRALWSRPLVALLFFLQPIVRGWARHRWRLLTRSVRPTTFQRRDALESPQSRGDTGHLGYWAPSGVDRYAFLQGVLAKLREEAWEWKTDTGWDEHDLEVFGRRWSRLQLVSVTEHLEDGGRTIRWRLTGRWSLPAKVVFWTTAGLEVMLASWLCRRWPSIWLLLFTLPVLWFLLERETTLVRRLVAAAIDEVAHTLGLVRLDLPKPVAPAPAPPPTAPPPNAFRDPLPPDPGSIP